MITLVVLAFFAGGAVVFFAIAACAVSKQADECDQKYFSLIGGNQENGLNRPFIQKKKTVNRR
jgi:hypothetical protein